MEKDKIFDSWLDMEGEACRIESKMNVQVHETRKILRC